MAAEVLAARPDQLDGFMQDQSECWHRPCCDTMPPLQRCGALDHCGRCLGACSATVKHSRGVQPARSIWSSVWSLMCRCKRHDCPWHVQQRTCAICFAGVATQLLASLLNPYSSAVRLAAQATLQHITQAAPRARVWLLQLLGAAQAVLMGSPPQVHNSICTPLASICSILSCQRAHSGSNLPSTAVYEVQQRSSPGEPCNESDRNAALCRPTPCLCLAPWTVSITAPWRRP